MKARTLLHIDSSITNENSVSRKVSAAIVARFREEDSGLTVVRRDLVAAPPAHLTLAHLPANEGEEGKASASLLDEFLQADTVVIGAPMYNFSIPSQLKSWLDRILIAGKTFRYAEAGPEGLAGGKRVVVAISRGGLYGDDSLAAALEHLETYLRGVFGFIGIVPEFVVAEGINLGPEQRDAAVNNALRQARQLQAA